MAKMMRIWDYVDFRELPDTSPWDQLKYYGKILVEASSRIVDTSLERAKQKPWTPRFVEEEEEQTTSLRDALHTLGSAPLPGKEEFYATADKISEEDFLSPLGPQRFLVHSLELIPSRSFDRKRFQLEIEIWLVADRDTAINIAERIMEGGIFTDPSVEENIGSVPMLSEPTGWVWRKNTGWTFDEDSLFDFD